MENFFYPRNTPWIKYVEYGLTLSNIILHVAALTFLKQHKDRIRNKNQRNIIAALCGFELFGALLYCVIYIWMFFASDVTLDVLFCFVLIFTAPNYYFIMGLLAIDRFLVFFLNIRYKFYVTSAKVIKLVISTVVICLANTIIFSVLIATKKISIQWFVRGIFAVFFIIDFAYIFLTLATYIYIFMVYRQQSRLMKNNQSIRITNHFKLLVPSLIVITFIFFTIIPNLVKSAIIYEILSVNEIFFHLSPVLYLVAWLINPLIYIFNQKFKRND